MINPVSEGIRHLRHLHNLTQKQLAEMAEIPRATLANMERNDSNPSILSIVKVSAALGVTVDELVKKQGSFRATMMSRNKMTTTQTDNGKFIITSASPLNAPYIQINEITMHSPCHSRGKPHPEGSQEFFLCLKGSATLFVQDEKHHIPKGDLIYFNGNLPHVYANEGKESVQAVSIIYMTNIKP